MSCYECMHITGHAPTCSRYVGDVFARDIMLTIERMIREDREQFANRIADEIERRIATRNGATASALAEVAEIVRSAGRQM